MRYAILPKSGIPFHAPKTYTPEGGKVKNYLTE
jgi:hypothetical protein